ncbi:MAG TPA: ThuA domain-containing protein [Solirubrobacterales bacterium]|nr:ThuA domain-containing protein [Solirubrobacterales bacterium]
MESGRWRPGVTARACAGPAASIWSAGAVALALAAATLVAALGGPAATVAPPAVAQTSDGERFSVLVFSRTTHHEDHRPSSNAGDAAMTEMGIDGDFSVTLAGDDGAGLFTHAGLRDFDVIVLNNNGGANVLNAEQRIAFERWMQRGGGVVGIHGASNSDTDWEWFGAMVGGAWFRDHPSGAFQFQDAEVEIEDGGHPATEHLPATWTMNDEWHAFHANPRPDVHVLATLDESSYDLAGTQPMGDHPIVWCTEYDGGRHLYSGLAHNASTWANADYREHIRGAIEWAAGEEPGDCGEPRRGRPSASSLEKALLEDDLQNPMSLQVAADGRVFFVEIGQLHGNPSGPENYIGRVKVHDPAAGDTFVVGEIPVHRRPGQNQNGLLGIALDPDFEQNGLIYLFYSAPNPGGLDGVQHVSRFEFDPGAGPVGEIDLDSEVVLLEIPHQRLVCCHSSGSLAFGPDGYLYASTGDDTEHSQSQGYAPIDQRPCGPGGWTPGDATCQPATWPEDSLYAADSRRTSGNTADLRGKILRIDPIESATPADEPGLGSTYTVDDRNLFTSGDYDHLFPGGEYDPELGRPEIYAMGLRNPFRFVIDPGTGWIYEGEVGPDANADNANRGPMGYDEINQIREAGNFGWPFCAADNRPYRRWTFPSGPAGAPYECEQGPVNDSGRNTGLDTLPPAQEPLIWYPYGASSTFPELPLGSGRAAFAGPVYHYDPALESDVKLSRWFDGKLIWADWSRRWLAATTLDGQGDYAGTERIMEWESFVRPHEFELGPDGALYIFEWGENYNYAGEGINPDSALYRIEGRRGNHPPVATASADRTSGPGPLTVNFTGELSDRGGAQAPEYEWDFGDGETSSQANPTHVFEQNGTHEVTLTVSDGTTEDSTSLQITVHDVGCVPLRSDHFEGDELDAGRWAFLHPSTQTAPTASGGNLNLALSQYGFDMGRPGPATILGQEMPAGDWEVVARIDAPGLAADNTGQSAYAKVGLIVFQDHATQPNYHWISYQHARNGDGNPPVATESYFEATAQNGTTGGTNGSGWTLGSRVGLGPVATNLPTFWLRVTRTGNLIEGFYSLSDPDTGATWTSINAGNASTLDITNFMPAGQGPIYVGPYGANGSTTVAYDYIRLDPDEFVCEEDVDPPVTTAAVLPEAQPDGAAEDVYADPVEVELSATDGDDEHASGVERTEYRVDGGDWETAENTDGDDPFRTYIPVSDEGEHAVEFRSVDNAGNVEETQSVEFEIDYDGELPETCAIDAVSDTWQPNHCEVRFGGTVTWRFGGGAQFPHDLWLIEPGQDPDSPGFAITDGTVPPGSDPVSHTLFQAGTWTYVCKLHSFVSGGNWQGMVGTVLVGDPEFEDTTPPQTTVALNGAAPEASYEGDVTATFTATDPGPDAWGVDYTEYRIDSGSDDDWATYNELSPPVVSAPGPHEIDYRSRDNVGNVENTKTVAFEIDAEVGEPALGLSAQPKLRKLSRKAKRAVFRVRASNPGDAATGPVRLCANAPKKRLRVHGPSCRTIPDLAPGAGRVQAFRLKVRRPARGKTTRVRVTARAGPLARKVAVRVKVKR